MKTKTKKRSQEVVKSDKQIDCLIAELKKLKGMARVVEMTINRPFDEYCDDIYIRNVPRPYFECTITVKCT